MSDSVQPQRWQPTRLPHPWDSPGKNTGVGRHILLQCMKAKSQSEAAQSCQLLVTLRTTAYQAPPSMVFSRQGYWSAVPLPSPCRDYSHHQTLEDARILILITFTFYFFHMPCAKGRWSSENDCGIYLSSITYLST